MKGRFSRVIRVAFSAPFLRRLGFHVRRLTNNVDRSFFLRLFIGLFGIVLVAALLVTVLEGSRDSVGGFFSTLGDSFYWGVTTVMGSGDASYVDSPGGYRHLVAAGAVRRGDRRLDHRRPRRAS